MVNGHNKARALQQAVEGAVNQMWTITALQLHPKGIIVCDEAACADLKVGTYNYFKDINDLLFRCVEDFCQEVGDFVAARTEGGAPGREGLRRTARAYVEYFVEYPGVFELFFLERLGGFGDRTETAALITGLLGRLCEPRLAECIADGTYTAGEAAAVEEGLRCMLPGMLLLYENRLAPDNYEEFMQSVDAQLGRVID